LIIHHIIADEWSMEVIHRDVRELYEAFSQGQPSPLPDLPIQYADFAAWQREWLQGEVLQGQLAYWKEEVAGAPFVLGLPTDKPRPAAQSFRGGMEKFELPKALLERLKSLGIQEQATLFMILEASFAALLHRYTGQDDILVGTPISDRTHSETEGLIGFFLNTFILRTRFTDQLNFRSLLQQVRARALGAYAHPDFPFERLVAELAPERDLSRTPLFQVMFVLADPEGVSQVAKLSSNPETGTGTSKFDLTLFMAETEDGLEGVMEYSADLFEAPTIQRLCGHYGTLLEALAGNPDQRISTLPLLTLREREQLLVGWNDTEVDYPGDACLHGLFEEQAKRTPDAVAVEFQGSQLSYRELNERANQLGHYLRGAGVGADTLVGVCMERSLEMVVALYGVLKAGGAYVPIDPEYPPERVAFMLEDADVGVLLTQTRLASMLPRYQGRVVSVDGEWEQIARHDVANPAKETGPKNLAYMIYTSGSTGRPKGAMNTHRGICNRLLWMQDRYGLTAADKVMQKTPFSFDVSVWEFFWPLLVGARLVVAEPGGHRDPAYLVKLIRAQGITVLHFVPSMLGVFLAEAGVEKCESLRHVMCSGEALPYDLQEQFFRLLRAQLHNLYGPTEAAVDVTHWTCRRGDERKIVPIGRPVANTQVYILDRYLQPVPMGVAGELHLGGVQVGRGYHQRPDLTAEKFIPDPFSGDPEARLYKTGDLCRWLSDGAVEYLGRMDFQVKIRGFRIELGEIESLLRSHAGVREAVVVVREEGEKRLVAYVVLGGEPGCTTGELRDYLRQKLPDYMVPVAWVVLPALPLNPNGKLDRKGLPAPEAEAYTQRHYEAPQGEMETRLAALWAEVLKVDRVGRHDNFFELGGHSLLATQLISRIRGALGIDVPLRSLFERPTVARFLEYVEATQWTSVESTSSVMALDPDRTEMEL
jgi:amino acid adenylation domain-containing protein